MPDPIFAHPRLAALYDSLDGPRDDLDAYEAIVDEVGARSVLDVGCGTGSLAVRLAVAGCDVTAVDPAAASLAVARAKPRAEHVRWLLGDATSLPADLEVDLAVMTGNVAQVFTTDAAWAAALARTRAALRPGGHLAFETRLPADRAWERWTPEATRITTDEVEAWCQVLDVAEPLITFRWTYRFPDGGVLTSDSTLRFRTRAEVQADLVAAGFDAPQILDAPDRPGRELVVLARRPG